MISVNQLAYLRLGASLYVPSNRNDLGEIASGDKYPNLRSVIFCTEDSVGDSEVNDCLCNLQKLLLRLQPSSILRFIRVRNRQVLSQLLGMSNIEAIDGFVFPKVSQWNCGEFFDQLPTAAPFVNMLTLETPEVFDPDEMRALRQLILHSGWRERVLSLRIGGNDLLQCLGMRRPSGHTIYETPLAPVIGQLVTVFRPHGFNLTAPVFDYFDRPALLADECRRDLAQGLFGKSSIHPEQISTIERAYRVSGEEYEMAIRLSQEDAPAVFRSGGAMCEVKTHARWAETTLARAEIYGVL